MTGTFVVFEGIDCSGKSTQLQLLLNYLGGRGYPVLNTREPGGTRIGELLRHILLDPANGELQPKTEAFLYAAARAQHVAEKIKPALDAGKVVLCDRFYHSTLAYQGWGRGIGHELLAGLNSLATGGLSPDLVILLDLPPEEALLRLNKKGRRADRLEAETLLFFQRVREGYLVLAREEPPRFKVYDARLPVDTINRDICSALEGILRAGV
jgi:dTMP kinase